MQQHVAALQAELKAAQAAADLEATLLEFKRFIDNGQHTRMHTARHTLDQQLYSTPHHQRWHDGGADV
jgi:hypothetical protein